jgi:putative transposase
MEKHSGSGLKIVDFGDLSMFQSADLGYFKYLLFDRIDRYGGYFVSRLKGNANPLIVGVNRKWRGNSVDVVGKKLRDILPRLKREILDVEVEVEF